MKTKIIKIIGTFILLVPFRLPIAVIMIKMFNYLAQLEGTILPVDILSKNVLVTKLTYDILLSVSMIYSIEILSRESLGRLAQVKTYNDEIKTSNPAVYWWTVVIALLLACYIIFDCISTYELFNYLYNE